MSIVRSNDTTTGAGEAAPQSHVFASLFSFSGEAQKELLAKLRANTPANEVQWLDDKHLSILSDNEATIMALFDLYAEYINTNSTRVQEPYEVQMLERPTGTHVRTRKSQISSYDEAFNCEDLDQESLLPMLDSHESVSKVWRFESRQARQLKKCLSNPSVIEGICNSTSCRLVLAEEVNAITVKGDNDQDLDKVTSELDKLAKSISVLDETPKVFHFFTSEAEMDASLQIQWQDESNDRMYAALPLSYNLPPERPKVGIITMLKKGRRLMTQSKTMIASSSPDFWRATPVTPHGNQSINFPGCEPKEPCTPDVIESRQPEPSCNGMSKADLTSGFVEQWVEQTSDAKNDPFEPTNDSETPIDTRNTEPNTIKPVDAKNIGPQLGKKRHGRTRRVPGGHDSESPSVRDTTELVLIPVDEAPEPIVPAMMCPPELVKTSALASLQELIGISVSEDPAPLAIALGSSSGTRSHGASRKSTPLEVRSGTPSTHVSATPKDILDGPEQPISYPVLTQAPSIRSPVMPPTSVQASNASKVQSNSDMPVWLKQNPTARASTEKKGARLIAPDEENNVSKPQSSYLEAAKRGAVRSRGLQRGRAGPRGRVCKALAPSCSERVQSGSEVESRQIFHTMHQKMAKPFISQAYLVKETESATAQILQSVRAFKGVVKFEVQIGRILVKDEGNAIGRTFSFGEWSTVFASQAENKVETLFTHMLPVSDTQMQYLINLRQSNGRRIFGDTPFDSTLRYRFMCRTRSGDEDIILEVSEDGHVKVLGNPHLVGAINWHFPKRQWDARLAVEAIEPTRDYEESVKTVANTLSIIPSAEQRTARVFAEIGNSDLIFKSASLVRGFKINCLLNSDIILSCSEIQDLGPAKERNRYYNSHRDVGTAKKNCDLWWEVRLCSTRVDDHLRQNREIRLGDQAGWRAEDITQSGVIQQLYDLASEIITQMDGTGATKKPVKTPSMNQDDTKDTGAQSIFW